VEGTAAAMQQFVTTWKKCVAHDEIALQVIDSERFTFMSSIRHKLTLFAKTR
jgi:hypothetical protein